MYTCESNLIPMLYSGGGGVNKKKKDNSIGDNLPS